MSMVSELVKELREYAKGFKNSSYGREISGIERLLTQAADTIEELSAKVARQSMERSSKYYGGGWILCSERMPKETGIYIVTTYSKEISAYIANIDNFVYTGYEPDGGCWINCEDNRDVLAWQPLPPAFDPKEDGLWQD